MAMDDRPGWLAARRQGIGGSDAAALVACSPCQSVLSLWANKTGRTPDDVDTQRHRWGRRYEAPILDEYAFVSGHRVADQSEAVPDRLAQIAPGHMMLRHPDATAMIGNTDGIVIGDPAGLRVIDAKTVEGWMFGDWLKAGRPPLYILVQLTHYMIISGLSHATVAAFTGLSDPLYVFEFELDTGFAARLMEAEDTFWRRYVVADQQPPADTSEATAKALRKIYPKDNGRLIQLTGPATEWAADFDDLTAEIKVLDAKREQAKTMLMAALGDAAAGELPDGSGFTYKTGARGRSLRRAGEKALRKFQT